MDLIVGCFDSLEFSKAFDYISTKDWYSRTELRDNFILNYHVSNLLVFFRYFSPREKFHINLYFFLYFFLFLFHTELWYKKSERASHIIFNPQQKERMESMSHISDGLHIPRIYMHLLYYGKTRKKNTG